jgi:hypothetical protein
MGIKRFNDLTKTDLASDQPYFRITTQRFNPGDSPEEPVTMDVDEATYTAMFTAASQAVQPTPPPVGEPNHIHTLLARADWDSKETQ